jgi:hypothetical protein
VLHLAVVFLVYARHDAQHGGFTGAVQAEQADLRAGEETEGDVLDDLTLGGDDLAHAEHRHYILSHLSATCDFGKRVAYRKAHITRNAPTKNLLV